MDGELTSWLIPGLNALLDLTAFIFALIYFRRCPTACVLVILATVGNLAVAVLREAVQVWEPPAQYWRLQGMLLRGCWYASCATYGLIVLAVFVGRGNAERPPQPLPMGAAGDHPAARSPTPTSSTAIEERK